MFTVMEELAQRVADRSPPSKFTSTASAFAMLRTLSVSALISSREYIMVPVSLSKRRAHEESGLTPYLLSVLRLVAAFVYVAHGTQKMFGVPGHPFHAPVFAVTLMGAAGVIETIGGILMLLGLFTRPVAFVLSGQMAVAYLHAALRRSGFWPIENGGELAVAVLFPLAALLRRRPGPDQRRRAARPALTRSEETAFLLRTRSHASRAGQHRPHEGAARRSVDGTASCRGSLRSTRSPMAAMALSGACRTAKATAIPTSVRSTTTGSS